MGTLIGFWFISLAINAAITCMSFCDFDISDTIKMIIAMQAFITAMMIGVYFLSR